jgi:amphi-Trp domain-containing protein
MADTKKFSHESIQDARSISALLHSLMEGLENERIVLTSDSSEIELHPEQLLKLSIRAEKKGDTSKIELKIKWQHKRESDVPAKGASLSITS